MPSPILRSRYKGQWVLIQLSPDDGWIKGKIRKMCREAGADAYEMQWENGEIEVLFVTAVFRIRPALPQKGRVIDFAKRRQQRLRVVPSES